MLFSRSVVSDSLQPQGIYFEMATHSSILAWEIPWAEEPGGLLSMGSQRVGTQLSNKHILNIFFRVWFLLFNIMFVRLYAGVFHPFSLPYRFYWVDIQYICPCICWPGIWIESSLGSALWLLPGGWHPCFYPTKTGLELGTNDAIHSQEDLKDWSHSKAFWGQQGPHSNQHVWLKQKRQVALVFTVDGERGIKGEDALSHWREFEESYLPTHAKEASI